MKEKKINARAVFISDTHLGWDKANAKELLKFLKSIECEYLYLLGDIIDIWSFKDTHFWNEHHTAVVKRILKMSKTTKVIYVTGNHDYDLHKLHGICFGTIEFCESYVHHAIDGRQILCIHGHQFDPVIQKYMWLAKTGSVLYDRLIWLSHYLNVARSLAGRVHWSLSAFLKEKIKSVVSYIGKFENTAIEKAEEQGVDSVICGHIHKAVIGDKYMNCGDWVESLTAIVEGVDGKFYILQR